MKKKRFLGLLAIGIICLSAVLMYWFGFKKPEPFLINEQLVEELNRSYPEADVGTIQDAIFLDEWHVFVPFISKENAYGLSFWEWQTDEWKAVSIHTAGQPQMWKVNRKDPSTYHFVWNIHPDDQLNHVKFYLQRNRGYRVSEGSEHYEPSVQLGEKVSLQGKSYGILQLPEEWVSFLTAFINVESAKQSNVYFNPFSLENYMYFGWIPYDQSDQEKFPEWSVHGNGFSNTPEKIEYIQMLDEAGLERWR